MKDTQANVIAVANGFKSRQGIISEAGGDIEDVLDEIAADNQLAESKGVELNAIGRVSQGGVTLVVLEGLKTFIQILNHPHNNNQNDNHKAATTTTNPSPDSCPPILHLLEPLLGKLGFKRTGLLQKRVATLS